jgi:predicted dehydrogenase
VTEPIRVGLIGFGIAGRVFHAPLVASTDGLALSAIVTADAGRRAQARELYPDTTIASEVAELWGAVDLVVVAAPNREHVPLASAAVERGLAVVVDKPLAPSASATQALLATGGRITVFQNRRFDGDFLTAARLVRDGSLGTVLRFESRFERFRPEVQQRWRELPGPEIGGGILLDLGPHLVDQACLLFGPPVHVYAELDTRRPGASVEDDAFVALEHHGGERSHLWMSAINPLHGPRLRVAGLTGGFETFGLDPQEDQLASGMRPGEPEYGRASAPGRFVDAGGARALELDRGAYERFYEGVVQWLRDGAAPPVDPRDSLTGLRVLDAARQSAATGTIAKLGT